MPVIKGKWLSDKIAEEGGLKEVIDKYRIVEIISGVGSGKNTWCKKLADMKYIGKPARILFITSRRAVANELYSDLRKIHGYDIKSKLDRHSFDSFPSFVVTTNSGAAKFVREEYDANDPSTHIWEHIDYILVDEAHSLSTDNFADDPFYLERFLRLCHRKNKKLHIVFMTGTPDPIEWMFSEKFKASGSFKCYDWFNECTRVVPDKIKIIDNTSAKEILMESLQRGEKSIYFIKSIERIKGLIEDIEKETGMTVTRDDIAIGYSKQFDKSNGKVGSDQDPRKVLEDELGEDYIKEHCDDIADAIVNNNKLPDEVKLFITTTKNKEGINILNDDINIMFAESAVKDEISQMAGRVRHGLKVMYLMVDKEIPFANDEPQYSRYRDERLLDDLNATLSKYRKSIELCDEIASMSNMTAKGHIEKFIEEIQNTYRNIMFDSVIDQKFVLYQGRVHGDEIARYCMLVFNTLRERDQRTRYEVNNWDSPFAYPYGFEGDTISGHGLLQKWFPGSEIEMIYNAEAKKEMEALHESKAREEIAFFMSENGYLESEVYKSEIPYILTKMNEIFKKHGIKEYTAFKAAMTKAGIDCRRINNKKEAKYEIGSADVPVDDDIVKADLIKTSFAKRIKAAEEGGFGIRL